MTQAAKTTLTMDKNGAIKRVNETSLPSWVLSIVATALAGCFAFLWNLNAEITKITQQNIEAARTMDELRIKINNMQLDIRDVRERIIRLETLNQKK